MGKLAFKPGDYVGPYAIQKIFKITGASCLYSIEEENLLIKTPVADATPNHLQQFRETMQILQKLHHPGIVEIIACGEEQGIPWYAMEKFAEATLADYLKKQGLPSSIEALRIGYRIVKAMAYAHSRDEPIWHGALTPENICFRTNEPVIINFVPIRFEHNSDVQLSSHENLLYMAPEQIRGHCDARSDIFSLGVILYQMLCGATPFMKDSENTTIDRVVENIFDLNIPAPGLEGYDNSIKSICEKALNKRADFRYADATEMVGDVKLALRKQLKEEAGKLEQQEQYFAAAELLREAVEYGLSMSELESFWQARIGRSLKVVFIEQASIPSARKAMVLKNHPHLIPILEVIEGEYPYLVVEALPNESLTQQIAKQYRLDASECVSLCLAVKSSLQAVKAANLCLRLEERRIFPGEPFRIAGLHFARLGYKEILARSLAQILIRALSGSLKPNWEQVPEIFRDILKRSMENDYSGYAISLAKDIVARWSNREKESSKEKPLPTKRENDAQALASKQTHVETAPTNVVDTSDFVGFLDNAIQNALSTEKVRSIFEDFFVRREEDLKTQIEKKHSQMMRTIHQKEQFINSLQDEKEELLQQLEKHRESLGENDQLVGELQNQLERYKDNIQIDSEVTPSFHKQLHSNVAWQLNMLLSGCKQFLAHVEQQNQEHPKEKEVRKHLRKIIDKLNHLKAQVNDIADCAEKTQLLIASLTTTEQIRQILLELKRGWSYKESMWNSSPPWTARTIQAVGQSKLNPSFTHQRTQAKLLAREEAEKNARRRLLEQVLSLKLDSKTLVRDIITEPEELSAQTSGCIRSSKIAGKHFDAEKGIYTVSAELDLYDVWMYVKAKKKYSYKQWPE